MTKIVILDESGIEQTRCSFDEFVIANDLEIEEALEIGNSLGNDGVYHGGGGAVPIYTLRLLPFHTTIMHDVKKMVCNRQNLSPANGLPITR